MGNEQSKKKELTRNGKVSEKIPGKHENGAANCISATITSKGLDIDVNGETIVQQNGGPLSLDLAAESPEPDYVVVESECPPADAPAISEILETAIQEEEVKKSKEEKVKLFGKVFKKKAEPPAEVKSVEEKESAQAKETTNEDRTDVSLPAPDPQLESDPSGDEAAAMIIAEHREDSECLHHKTETSTQTDKKTEADISTQTGDSDDDTTTNAEGPVEEEAVMETAAIEEHSPDGSPVVIAEEAVEETANEKPSGNQTAKIITEEVVIMRTRVYENLVFRAERVEVADNFEISHIKSNPEGDSVNESEPEVTAEPESTPNKSIIESETIAEENNVEETLPLEISFSLPKVVADCVEVVFAAVSESTDCAAVNSLEPSADEVITEDNGGGARDMSADVVLIETAEPESNAVTPEAGESNGVPSPDEEPVTTLMETISEVVCEEPNPTPANQEELSVPVVTEILVKVESAHEEVTANDAVAIEDVPGISEEIIIVEAPSNVPNTTEELLDGEVKHVSIPEVIIIDENNEVVEDVTAEVGQETVEEAEPSPVIIKDDVEVIPEVAIDALSQELSAIPPQEHAVDNGILLKEEVIAATTFMPLSGEREASLTIPEEPSCKTLAEETEEAIEALSSELEAVPESVEEDTTVPELSAAGEVTGVASYEEPVEEKTSEISEDVLAQAETAETPRQVPVISEGPAEENPSSCEEDATTAVLETILESVVDAISEKFEITENIVEVPANEQADVPPMNATGESEPCFSVQEELVEENVNPAEVLLKDTDKETVAPSAVAVKEPTNSNPENIVEEPADVPPMGATGESEPCVSVKEELVEENVAPTEVLLEDASKGTATPSAVAVKEPTNSNPENIVEEPSDVPQMDTTGESEPCVSVKEELVEENVTPTEVLLEDGDKETAAPSVVSVEDQIDSKPENIVEEPTDEQADVPPMSATGESELCISVQEELEEENVAPTEVLLKDADKETAATSVVAVEEPTNSNPENIVEEPADVPQMDTTGESEPCISVKEGLVEENVAPTEVLLEDGDKETAAPFMVAVKEPTDSKPENIVEEPADVPQMDTTGQSEPCVSVKEELVEENFAPTEVPLKDADKETAASSVVAVEEPTDSNPENIVEEPADERADVPPTDATGESEPCVSVQQELVEENIAPTEVLLEDANKKTAALSAIAVEEPTDSNPENIVEGPADERADMPLMAATAKSEHCISVQENVATPEVLLKDADKETTAPPVVAVEESKPCISVEEELVEENNTPPEVLLGDMRAAPSVVAVEEPTSCNSVISEKHVAESASLLVPQALVVIIDTIEEVTEEIAHEADDTGDVLAAVDEISEDSQIATSNEPVAECVEAILEKIVEEIITEDIVAECNLVASKEVAPEIIAGEGQTEEKAENESSVNSTDSTQSAEMIEETPVTSTDMDALLVRLQSACTSVVEESAYRAGGLQMSSLGNNITVTIHVAPKEQQQ